MSSERLFEHKASRVAISANKGKPKREPRISLSNICGHNFPLELAQLASLNTCGDPTGVYASQACRLSPELQPIVDKFGMLPPDKIRTCPWRIDIVASLSAM